MTDTSGGNDGEPDGEVNATDRRGRPFDARYGTPTNHDLVCIDCEARSREGYQVSTGECPAGDGGESHDWWTVDENGGETDQDDAGGGASSSSGDDQTSAETPPESAERGRECYDLECTASAIAVIEGLRQPATVVRRGVCSEHLTDEALKYVVEWVGRPECRNRNCDDLAAVSYVDGDTPHLQCERHALISCVDGIGPKRAEAILEAFSLSGLVKRCEAVPEGDAPQELAAILTQGPPPAEQIATQLRDGPFGDVSYLFAPEDTTE